MKMQVAGFRKFLGVAFVLMAGSMLWAEDAYEETVIAYGEREFRLGPAEEAVVAFDEREFYLGPVRIARAVVADAGKTLRFVYDGEDVNHGTKDTDWFSVAEAEAIDPVRQNVPWYGVASQITNVVFDASFKAYQPEQCALWLYFFSNLKAVDGMENLDTSKVKSMYRMFTGDWDLLSLDLSALDTGSVTNMFQMFMNCMSIKTIYASERFVTSQVGNSVNMFMDCSALIGGNGTKYDSTKTDKTYARIDGGTSAPGYFTYKPNVPAGSFAIHFAADGGTGTMSDQICKRGKVFKLTKCAFTKSGKTFKGWKCSNEKRYDDQILIFDLTESGTTVTMTAVWE